MTPLVFLDTETTGLDPAVHQVWEVAWAVEDGPVRSYVVPHDIVTADVKALDINGYWQRFPTGAAPDFRADAALRAVLDGATVVGSNPAFDTAFLRARWHAQPWHHRLVNVAEGAMWLFGWERPKGLADVVKELRNRGYDIPDPDHTAAGDVEVTRAVYRALREVTP